MLYKCGSSAQIVKMKSFPFIQMALALVVTHASADTVLKPDFMQVHRSEPFLLHRSIETAQIRAFRIWDSRLADWRNQEPGEMPARRASVMVLHLWADWCLPCREELPAMRQLTDDLEQRHGDRVQVVLLSETSAPEAMRAFLEKQRDRMPRGPLYFDTGESVATALRAELPTSLSYPVTLILDSQRIVRHAIVGSIAGRRAELLTAIAHLVTSPSTRHPAP